MNFESSVLQIPIEEIVPNRFQPRLFFDENSLSDLANSIKAHGIIQPLVLRKVGDKYEIVSGERRYRAARMAGLINVPAVITTIDDKLAAEMAISENVQRQELNPIEEAKSYDALLKQGYMSKEILAQKMGIPLSVLESKLNLLNLTPEVQDALMYNRISERHARSLMNIKEPKEQIKWLNNVIEKRMTVKELDNEIMREYGNQSVNVDINRIKEESTDINVPNIPAPVVSTPQQSFGPVNLGEKPTNRFFNNLEDESVNMNTMENVNPLNNNYMTFNEFTDNLDNSQPSSNMNQPFAPAQNNVKPNLYQANIPAQPTYQQQDTMYSNNNMYNSPVPDQMPSVSPNMVQYATPQENDYVPNMIQNTMNTPQPNMYTDNLNNGPMPMPNNFGINNQFDQSMTAPVNSLYSPQPVQNNNFNQTPMNNMYTDSLETNVTIPQQKDVLPAKIAILNTLNSLNSEYKIIETDEDYPDRLVITITIDKGQ